MSRATLPHVTPQIGSAGTGIGHASDLEIADAWDSDDPQFGTNDSHNKSPVANETRRVLIAEEEAGGDAEDHVPMQEGRRVDSASSFRNLFTHKRSWGKMGIALFVVIMLTQLEMSSRLPETLRSESRDTMMAVGNSTFHELLSKTEKALSARRGFSIVGGDWVSTVAIVLVAVTFGGAC
jgi:hypothetical protein